MTTSALVVVRIEIKDKETGEVYDIMELDVSEFGLDIHTTHLIKGVVADRIKALQVSHE